MPFDPTRIAQPGILGLKPYVPGKPAETLKREYGLDQVVKLASNENPLGPPPEALAALESVLPELARYPDGEAFRLKAAIAERLEIEPDQLTLGNGSNDVLELIGRTFSGPGVDVIYSQYAFAVYALVTQAVGARPIVVPASQWGHDLDAMAEHITPATRLIYLANPNNPTGSCFNNQALANFLKKVPAEVLVVLDEAYFEYFDPAERPDGIQYLSDYPNLLVCRTFSKAYGLAGLRVGYSVSHPDVAELLNRVRQPFNVNLLAQAAALGALQAEDYLRCSIEVNRAGLTQLETGLRHLGIETLPSHANFLVARFDNAMEINEVLLRNGVIVRPLQGYGMPDCLRISVGLEAENQRLLDVLATHGGR